MTDNTHQWSENQHEPIFCHFFCLSSKISLVSDIMSIFECYGLRSCKGQEADTSDYIVAIILCGVVLVSSLNQLFGLTHCLVLTLFSDHHVLLLLYLVEYVSATFYEVGALQHGDMIG